MRVTRGRLEKARTCSLGPRVISHRRQVIREGTPGIGKIGIEGHRRAQLGNGILAPCQCAQGHTEFEVRRGRAGLSHGKRRQHRERRGRIAAVAARNTEDQ